MEQFWDRFNNFTSDWISCRIVVCNLDTIYDCFWVLCSVIVKMSFTNELSGVLVNCHCNTGRNNKAPVTKEMIRLPLPWWTRKKELHTCSVALSWRDGRTGGEHGTAVAVSRWGELGFTWYDVDHFLGRCPCDNYEKDWQHWRPVQWWRLTLACILICVAALSYSVSMYLLSSFSNTLLHHSIETCNIPMYHFSTLSCPMPMQQYSCTPSAKANLLVSVSWVFSALFSRTISYFMQRVDAADIRGDELLITV
jgi:hypothetical protein